MTTTISAHDRIIDQMDMQIHDAYRQAADDMLVGFREQLAKYNLRRHPLTVRRHNGEIALFAGDTIWFEVFQRGAAGRTIWDIGRLIDIHRDTWGAKLEGRKF